MNVPPEKPSKCSRCGYRSKRLLHCSHLSPGNPRHWLCIYCRHAIHLAGVMANDPECLRMHDYDAQELAAEKPKRLHTRRLVADRPSIP